MKRVNLFQKKTDSSVPFLCKIVIITLIIGILLRLLIGFFTTHIYDVYHWGVVIQNINSGNGLYEITGYFYTPVWGYIMGIVSMFQDFIGVDLIGTHVTELLFFDDIAWYFTSTVTTPEFNITLKFVYLISDMIVGYLIFWIIRDVTNDQRKAAIGFALWFLCPLVIASGFVVGMFDTISALMTLLSIILLRKGRYFESGVLFSMVTLLKFFPGFFIFIFIAYIMKKHKDDGLQKIKVTYFILGIAITSFILFLPQILDGTIADCFLFITSRISEGTVGDASGGSFIEKFAILSYVLTIFVSIYYSRRIYKKDSGGLDGLFFNAVFVTTLIMFLYPPLPQYILLLLPFFIFALLKDKKYRIPFCLVVIGGTLQAVGAGPIDFAAVAVYTDMMDLDSLIQTITGWISDSPSYLHLVSSGGQYLAYVGLITTLIVHFNEQIKNAAGKIINRKKNKTNGSDN